MSDPNQEAFEKDATHLGYNCAMVGGKYSLYTGMAWKLWNAALRYEEKKAAKELKAYAEGLQQERPGT